MTTERTPAIERAAGTYAVAHKAWNEAFQAGEAVEPAGVFVARHMLANALDVQEIARAGYAHRARRQIDAGDPPEWWPYWSDLSDERRKQELDRAAAVCAAILGGPTPTQQPRHIGAGANAEDCPACAGTNPPYPFICPGEPDAAQAAPPAAHTASLGWPTAGESVRVVRRSWTGHVDHEYTATVERRTPARVILDSGARFRPVRDQWHETPRYIDYTTVLEPVTGAADA